MNMKKIELLGTRDLRHLHRERQSVIGTREDRRVSHLDLVEMNARERKIEPDRFGVTEKMDVVTARCQLSPERGRENAAAADERETNDADLERLACTAVDLILGNALCDVP